MTWCIVAAIAAVWVALSVPVSLLMYSLCVVSQREDERHAAACEALRGRGEL